MAALRMTSTTTTTPTKMLAARRGISVRSFRTATPTTVKISTTGTTSMTMVHGRMITIGSRREFASISNWLAGLKQQPRMFPTPAAALHTEANISSSGLPAMSMMPGTNSGNDRLQQQQQQMMDQLRSLMRQGKTSVRFFQMLFWGTDDAALADADYPKLRAWIRQYVNRADLRDFLLQMANSIELDEIGKPYADDEGNVHFAKANLYFVLDDLALAKESYEKSYQALQKRYAATAHPDVACSLGSLGSINFQEGNFENALKLYEKALDLETKFFGENHLQLAQTLHNIAMTCLELNDMIAAKKAINRAIEIKRSHYANNDHPDLALSLSGLGDILKADNNLDLAKLAYEETVKIFENVHGKNHFEIPHNLMEIAAISRAQYEFDEAAHLLNRALKIHRETFGENDVSQQLVRLLEMMGDVYKNLDEQTDAIGNYSECLKVLLKLSPEPEKDSNIARIKFNLSILRMETQPIEETVAELKDAAAIYRRAYGSDDLNLALTLHTLGAALVRQGRRDDAMQAFEEALVIRRNALGKVHELVGDSLTDIGYVLLVQERYADAERRFRSALDVYYKCLSEDQVEYNPKLALAHYHLANACYMLSKTPDAEKNFARALEISRTALGPDHPQVISLETMVRKLLPNRQF